MAINENPHIHNLVMCANIFVRKDGKYLLLRRSENKKYAPGVCHPIGGKIDKNEDPYRAGRREVLEESGVTVKNMRLEAVIYEVLPHPGEEENWLIFHFSADWEAGEVGTTEEGELVLLSEEELRKERLFPSVQAALPHILDPEGGTAFLTCFYDEKGSFLPEKAILNVAAR